MNTKQFSINIFNYSRSIFFLSILITLFLPNQLIFSQTLNSGLVAYYPFDGNADDYSGNRRNGRVHEATPTTNRYGENNKALLFDGSQSWVDLGSYDGFPSGHNPYSICIWINISSQNQNGYILACGAMGYQEVLEIYYVANDGIWVMHYGHDYDVPQKPYPIKTNTWHFLTVTYDGNRTGRIYLNGILVGERNFPDQLSIVKTNLYVGKRYISNPEFLRESLDELRIYNRALSTQEIQSLYSPNQLVHKPYANDFVSKENARDRAKQILVQINNVTEQVQPEKRGTGKILRILLSTKEKLQGDPNYINEAENALSESQNKWQTIQSLLSLIDHLSLQIEQLKKENLNVTSIEKALEESKNQLEGDNYDLIQNTLSDAQANADNTWSAYQYITQVRSNIKQIAEMGADIDKSQSKLKEALDALEKGSASIAIEKSKEASVLAENANFGKINIMDLRALSSKYDRHNVTISGTLRNIETIYGRGYKFGLDDGSGLITVVYEGSLKGINDGEDAIIQGVFSKSQDLITASKIDKPGFFSITKLLVGIILLAIVAIVLFFRKNLKILTKGHGA